MSFFTVLGSSKKIGIVASSAALQPERLARGVAELERRGLSVVVAGDPAKFYDSKEHLFSSDSAAARVAALHSLYTDTTVGAILSARGAYGAAELLPLLDFELIRRNPKPIIGFSDTTFLLNGVLARAGVPGLHAPALESGFAFLTPEPERARAADTLVAILRGEIAQPFAGVALHQRYGVSTTAAVRGVCVGGNLSVLCSMIGTPWEPALSESVLFLEEIGEKPYRVHRMLLQLRQSGRLAGVAAVVLGNFRDCVHPKGEGPTLDDVFADIFADAPYPVFGDLPAGHVPGNLPLPIGVEVEVGAELRVV